MRLLQIDYSLREISLPEFMYRKIQVIIYLANTLNNKWILLFTLHYSLFTAIGSGNRSLEEV
jgi:hypothetical protein